MNTTKSLQINKTYADCSIKFVYTNTLLMALIFFGINSVLAPTKVAHAGAVKWHPGHYYTIMSSGKNKSEYMDKVHRELKATPALRGLQIRYLWAELETDEDVYDFTAIDQRLEELAAQQKRLIIQVQTKSFDLDWTLVPVYLKASKYEGGVFPFSKLGNTIPRGYNIKLWNDNVRNRLVKLFRKLGERYNSHPYFEGIGMIESALGDPTDAPMTSDQVTKFFDNLIYVHKNMRAFFPNTMTIQEMNYPRPVLESVINSFPNMGTTLSSPDLRLDDPGLSMEGNPYSPDGVYSYYSKLSGYIPMAPTVMETNYENTREDGTGYEPTILELLAFARDKLKANYIFWTRHPEYYYRSKILEMLNGNTQKGTSSGGLNSACPKTYTSCND